MQNSREWVERPLFPMQEGACCCQAQHKSADCCRRTCRSARHPQLMHPIKHPAAGALCELLIEAQFDHGSLTCAGLLHIVPDCGPRDRRTAGMVAFFVRRSHAPAFRTPLTAHKQHSNNVKSSFEMYTISFSDFAGAYMPVWWLNSVLIVAALFVSAVVFSSPGSNSRELSEFS